MRGSICGMRFAVNCCTLIQYSAATRFTPAPIVIDFEGENKRQPQGSEE